MLAFTASAAAQSSADLQEPLLVLPQPEPVRRERARHDRVPGREEVAAAQLVRLSILVSLRSERWGAREIEMHKPLAQRQILHVVGSIVYSGQERRAENSCKLEAG